VDLGIFGRHEVEQPYGEEHRTVFGETVLYVEPFPPVIYVVDNKERPMLTKKGVLVGYHWLIENEE
jgi:hypothetical protein